MPLVVICDSLSSGAVDAKHGTVLLYCSVLLHCLTASNVSGFLLHFLWCCHCTIVTVAFAITESVDDDILLLNAVHLC